jgi:hypothetical protein
VQKYGEEAVAEALEAVHINAEDASEMSGEDAEDLYMNQVDYFKQDPTGLIDIIKDMLYDDDGNSTPDPRYVMKVVKLGGKFFQLMNKVDLIPVEKWLQSKKIPTNKVKAAINAETFTEFENILRADFPGIYEFHTGDDHVGTIYVYDLGDGTVAMVDDYVDGFSLHSKAAFEKFKEVLKQASDKPKA